MNFKQRLFLLAQYLLPQHCLSRLVGFLAQTKIKWLKDFLIQQFAKRYQVNLNDAEVKNLTDFASFNDFFTRKLIADARPIDKSNNSLVIPADGYISQLGKVNGSSIIQAKNKQFSLGDLLGNYEDAEPFIAGDFINIYLSPSNYHRVHMPVAGTLQKMIYIPGKLFSVNKLTADNVPNLFARNERVVCIFDTEIGQMALVLVGAMIVAGIETVWAGQIAPITKKPIIWNYTNAQQITLNKGAEMGRFKLGSTVIAIFAKDKINLNEILQANNEVKMGQNLGVIKIDDLSSNSVIV